MGECFKPRRIAEYGIELSDELIANSAEVDFEFARLDEASVRYPYGSSLRKSLARLEAIATVSISEATPDLLFMTWVNAMHVRDPELVPRISDYPFVVDGSAARAAMGAVRYMRVVNRIIESPADAPLSQEQFKQVHAYLSTGVSGTGSPAGRDSGYRTRSFARTPENAAFLGRSFILPAPREIPGLMNDLFDYLATPRYAPSLQAAIVHFQMQAICPFESMMDRMERLLSLSIMHRGKVALHLVPCIGFALASGYGHYTAMLMPYRDPNADATDLDEWLSQWVRCCYADLRDAIRLVRNYMSTMNDIVASYREKIGSYRKGSVVDVILRELPGLPLIDSAIAMKLTGKGFTAVSDALKLLEKRGVIRQVGTVRRSRLYIAEEISRAEQSVLDRYLPGNAPGTGPLCF